MPCIKVLRDVGIGDGSDPTYARDVHISADFAGDLSDALDRDHTGRCDSNCCDICAAEEQGFTFSAASLLQGATECVNVERTIAAHEFNGTYPAGAMRGESGWPSDWEDWCAWHTANGRQCAACGAYVYYADADTCGNCLARLPRSEDEDTEGSDDEG